MCVGGAHVQVPAEALVSDLLDLRLQGIMGSLPFYSQTDLKAHPSATPLPSRTHLLVLLKTVH